MRPARTHRHRWDGAIRALVVLTIAVNVIYFGALLLPGDPAPTLIDVVMPLIAQSVPVAVFWLAAARTGFARPEVILAAAGVTFNAAGDIYYSLAMDAAGELSSPSPADVGYLLYYPLIMAALLVLVVRQSQGSLRSALFDAAVASLGAAAVLAVVLEPVFTDATSSTDLVGNAIASLYPLFDLLLICTVVAIVASPMLRLGPRWQFLVLGFLLFAIADIAYALLTHEGAYTAGTPLDAAWAAGVAAAAIWVDGVTRLEPASAATASQARALPIPALAVIAGLGVLLFASQSDVSIVALVLAAATVALAAFAVTFRHAALARLLEGRDRVVQQLNALDKAKSDLIQTMSHEMRTPLTSILGYLDLVLDDEEELSADTRARLRVVERHAGRLHDLAGNMLVLAGLDSGTDRPTPVRVDLGVVLQHVEDLLRPLADSRGVDLQITGRRSLSVDGDEDRLERAVTNVVENALKFTPASGQVRVELLSGVGPDGRPRAVVRVADTGVGIPADELPRVFDRFHRTSSAQELAIPGTGLGLAIARETVTAHRGEVTVSSAVGEGTTVRIVLPVQSMESRAHPGDARSDVR